MAKSKKSNGAIGSKKAAKQEPQAIPTWRPHLDNYRDLQRLVFVNDDELDKAIELLWTDALRDLPHDSPDGRSIVIPKEAVEYFVRVGLKFSAEKQLSISDLTTEEIAALRRSR